jgi:hypothetical protein
LAFEHCREDRELSETGAELEGTTPASISHQYEVKMWMLQKCNAQIQKYNIYISSKYRL